MSEWQTIRKIANPEPLGFGNSTAFPILPRAAGLGMSIGFSEFVPGSSEVDVPKPECFLVYAGELEIVCGDQSWTLRKGEAIWMPAGSKVTAIAHQPCSLVYAIILD